MPTQDDVVLRQGQRLPRRHPQLQLHEVEHPVTEAVTGLDLVELQLRVAAGAPLPLTQAAVVLRGHAVEVRVYAEDPAAGFLPTGGRVLALDEPRDLPGVRVDSGIAAGFVVGSEYDPMLLKIVAHGADRAEALHRLDAALRRTVLLGLGTNIGFLRALLADPDVRAGNLDTGLVGRRAGELAKADLPDDVVGLATGIALLDLEPRSDDGVGGRVVDPFDIPGGWRVGEHAWTTRRVAAAGHDPVEVRSRGRAASAELVIDGGAPLRVSTTADHRHTQSGITRGYAVARSDDGVLWVSRDGLSWAVREQEALEAAAEEAVGAGGPVLSPMPGTVTVVEVVEGQRVAVGQRLVAVEAMKMEHVLTAPVDGTVRELRARPGVTVAKDAVLLVVEANASEGQVQDGRVSG